MRLTAALATVLASTGAEAQFAGRTGAVLAHDAAECSGVWRALGDAGKSAWFDGIAETAIAGLPENRRRPAERLAMEARDAQAGLVASLLRTAAGANGLSASARARATLADARAPCDFMEAEALADAEVRTME